MQLAILAASGLLLIGFVLRAKIRLFQLLFIPASVLGGALGLLLFQAVRWSASEAPDASATWSLTEVAATAASTLRTWPGALIAVVFAGLLLEKPEKRFAESMRGAATAGIMVWIIVLGEVALGLGATWLLVMPVHDVPPAFGQLIEAGFAGGHGTAAALGTIYAELLDFPEGVDLGLFVATAGLVFGVVSGIVLINVAVRRGWTASGRADVRLVSGLESRDAPSPIAWGRVRGEVIDPLAFQLLVVAAAFGAGVALRWAFIAAARGARLGEALQYVENVPLFVFTLIGGLLVRKVMTLVGAGDLIDADSIKRIVAIAMEFLIVAAIASLRIEAVATYFWPLALLLVLGGAWTIVCLLVLSRLLLPPAYWFELGILNYGMSTGTTAQGMMLLRIVDEDLASGAAEDYAMAAPLSAPFIGGGVITFSLPLVLQKVQMPVVIAIIVVLMAGMFFLGRLIRASGSRPGTPPHSDARAGGPE